MRGRVWSGLRRRWRRVLARVAVLVVAGYGVTYASVSLAHSPTTQSVDLPGGRTLAYTTYHSPPEPAARVVLVHGSPADAGCWASFVRREGAALDPCEVLAVDRLGYGNSSPGAEVSLEAQAKALGPLITPGTVLVGHSYGGPVVLRAAVEYSDRLAGIALVASACDAEMQDATLVREVIDGVGVLVPGPWHVANAELLALTDENDTMRGELSRVTCPVVIVHGTWDPVCPPDGTVAYLQRALINAESVTVESLEHAGHNLHLSHPKVIADAVQQLVEQD